MAGETGNNTRGLRACAMLRNTAERLKKLFSPGKAASVEERRKRTEDQARAFFIGKRLRNGGVVDDVTVGIECSRGHGIRKREHMTVNFKCHTATTAEYISSVILMDGQESEE